MAKAKIPQKVFLRTYQVGFGDCFLLTFQYAKDDEKHILIDFGSTGLPPGTPPDQMRRVANDIHTRCGGALDIIVATHRHKDHISGFTTNDNGTETGDIIRSCKPKVVIQPWTEDPDLEEDAKSREDRISDNKPGVQGLRKSSVSSLQNMGVTAANIRQESAHFVDSTKFVSTMERTVADQIKFLTGDAELFAVTKKTTASKTKSKAKKPVANASAVENLNTMDARYHYVEYGYKLNLASFLPGVKVTVLGPPSIKQYDKVQKERSTDKEEFWMLSAATSNTGSEFIDGESRLFPEGTLYNDGYIPQHARWFVRNLRSLRGDQLLQIARSMDAAANNTSVILMFEVGREKMLFPGDAQIENWEYALKVAPDKDANLKLLKGTTFYKVGHHGSRNATPRTLWNNFANREDEGGESGKLKSVVSTMADKHGSTVETAVPRQTLITALKKGSGFYTTQKIDAPHEGAADSNEPGYTRREPGLWGEVEITLK